MVPMVISHRRRTVEIYMTAGALSDRACELIIRKGEEAVRRSGVFTLALSGGRSPLGLYELLAAQHSRPFWRNTHIFCVDERFVPWIHQDSNARLLREHLLSSLPLPEYHIHLISTESGDPEESRRAYEEELERHFSPGESNRPLFDMIMLGIGDDGHTASLFPGSRTLLERKRLVVASDDHKAPHRRISMSLLALNRARQAVFLAMGRSKAKLMKSIVADMSSPYPAAMVMPVERGPLFLIDLDAACELTAMRLQMNYM